ncbi:MAG: S8 family serine peptidase [Verrucomicrobiota bacterium]
MGVPNNNSSPVLYGRILTAAIFICTILIAFAAPAGEPPFVPGRLLVKARNGLSETNLATRLRLHGATTRQGWGRSGIRVVEVPETQAGELLASLRKDPDILYAERDYIASAVPLASATGWSQGWHVPKIQAPEAWSITTGTSNVLVAVLDSGIDFTHPALAGQCAPGYDWVNGDSDPSDDFGHGTAVSGVIAAARLPSGVPGIAFGCRLLPVKVMDSGGYATYSCIAQGIRYAADQGARVINISIAGSAPSATLQDAVDYAWSSNVLVVAAAGNSAGTTLQYPAACSKVLAVSATEPEDTLASFSSWGNDIALAAPGDEIWTTQNDAANRYGPWRGTSFASPMAAATAALVLSENPTLSGLDVAELLEQTADQPAPISWTPQLGWGRVNAFRAVIAASILPGALGHINSDTNDYQPPQPPPDVTPPFLELTQSPRNGAALATADVRLAGIAGDDTGVLEVQLDVNGVRQIAEGTTQWAAQLTLDPGRNLIRIRSVDAAGNVSPDILRRFVCNPSVFTNAQGIYAGLVTNANALSPANSGGFRLALNRQGSFTGKICIDGRTAGFHGRLGPDGTTQVTVKRGKLAPLTVTLQAALDGTADSVSGLVSGPGWESPLAARRDVFDSRRFPAAQAGSHAFLLQQIADPSRTAAVGFSRISRSGTARFRGRLVDRRPFAAATLIARNGDCPLYLSFHHGKELMIGWMNFPDADGAAPPAVVHWVNSETNGFATSLQAAVQ